jgi:hypothetical protein
MDKQAPTLGLMQCHPLMISGLSSGCGAFVEGCQHADRGSCENQHQRTRSPALLPHRI